MSGRDQENKDRENYHTNTQPVDPLTISAGSLKKAEDNAKKIKLERDESFPNVNHDVFFISDEEFQKELDHLPMNIHSNVVLCIGPRIKTKVSKTGLMLDERSIKEAQTEELNKIPSGMRIVGISNSLLPEQQTKYSVGDYLFTVQKANHTIPANFEPLNPEFAYYENKTIDARFTMTQEKVIKLAPAEFINPTTDETKGGE